MAHRFCSSARGAANFRRNHAFAGFPIALTMLLFLMAPAPTPAQDIEREPINYSGATPRNNVVAKLEERIASGEVTLEYEADRGYLRSLLRALNVPESSQVLVFSKTSMQRERIAPKTPRAVYFNDDVMIGFCLRGRVLEISAADADLGTVFYTLDQSQGESPAPLRQTESCLLCHSSSSNQGFPGHLVRSLYVDRQGNPLLHTRAPPAGRNTDQFRPDAGHPLWRPRREIDRTRRIRAYGLLPALPCRFGVDRGSGIPIESG